MRKIIILLIFSAIPFATTGDSGVFGVKGVSLGDDFSIIQALPSIRCNKSQKSEFCLWLRPKYIPDSYKTIATIPADMYAFYAIDGKVQKIEVGYPSSGHEHLKSAITDKYGKPQKTEESVIQNRMGANFLDDANFWQASNGDEMNLHKYARGLDTGVLIITTQRYRQKDIADAAERKQKALNDL